MKHWICLTLLSLTATACAQATKPAVPEPGFSLTIYSTADPAKFDPQELVQWSSDPNTAYQVSPPGYGVVREVRKIDLKAGMNDIRFADVASTIDATTVAFVSLTDPQHTSVFEQNFEFDLLTSDKLLKKYLDQPVKVDTKAAGATAGGAISGTLLAFDTASLTLQGDGGEITVLQRAEVAAIHLAKRPSELHTKPTLLWKISAAKAGTHDAQVTYQIEGVSWRADYTAVLNANDTAVDLSSWVTLMNQSGVGYPDTKLKLVAGDVHRLKPPPDFEKMIRGGLFGGSDTKPEFLERGLFEYHVYALSQTTTLPNNSTKQLELFSPRANVPVEKIYLYYGLPENLQGRFVDQPVHRIDGVGGESKVHVYIRVANAEKGGLGVPLPAGRVRLFKRDIDGSAEFVGEDVIQHTPVNERALFRLGTAFDLVGERKQTNFEEDHQERWAKESFEIKLRNHKKEAVNILIREDMYRGSQWKIEEISEKFEKKDYLTIHIPVDVPAGGEKTVTYSVKYTW